MHGIRRIDHEPSRTHSWLVTLQRRKRIYHRHFSDGRYGGKRKALAAAQTYRATLIAELPALSRQERCSIRRKNNRSGISGVSRHELAGHTPRSPRRAYWIAQWPIGRQKAKMRKFSVKRYGEEGAFRRAVAARRRALAALT
jgi:hypothetical protein